MREWNGWLVALFVGVLVGLSLAAGRPEGDFANYWTAASLVAEGSDVRMIYDYRWFTEQAARLGFGDRPVGFPVLTPPSALILTPLVGLPRVAAEWVFAASEGIALGIAAVLGCRASRCEPVWAVAAMVALLPAIRGHLHQGQVHLFMVLAVSLFGWLWVRRSPAGDVAGGALLAVAIGLKVHAWPLIGVAILARRWRLVLATLGTLLLGGAVSVVVLGWPVHVVFFSEVAPAAGGGWFTNPWPEGPQSLPMVTKRLFVHHPALNPTPLVDVPVLAGGLVSAALAGAVGSAWTSRPSLDALAAALLASIATGALLASYHLVWLLPVLLWTAPTSRSPDRALRAGLWVAIAVASWAPVGTLPLRLVLLLVATGLALRVAGARPNRWVAGGILGMAVVGGLSARSPDTWAGDHPDLPIIAADLVEDDEGVLWFSGLPQAREVPGRGWVGYRWDPPAAPEVVAWDAEAHTWSPTVTATGVGWHQGPGAYRPKESGGDWVLSDSGTGVFADRPRPRRVRRSW